MTLPLYQDSAAPGTLPANAHAGLWWEKFFNCYDGDWQVPDGGKVQWVETVKGGRGKTTYLKAFAARQFALGTKLGAQQKVFQTDWHFATGLGLSHPMENGFTWHPTLGVPYLPASGVKGLLRGWVEQWQDFPTEDAQQQTVHRWFGCDEKDNEKAGDLIFFDAVPVDRVELAPDVMTPHLGKWYEQGDAIGNIAREPEKIPADWHSPVPVVFLVVKQASFLFQIAARGNTAPSEAAEAMTQLQCALELLGAGAKTAVGYGRMLENTKARERLAEEQRKVDEKRAALAPARPVVETLEEEIVTMVEAPQADTVQVKTEGGTVVPCRGLNAGEARAHWQSGATEFFALVTHHNGVPVGAVWQGW